MMTIFQPFANTLWNSLKDTEITKVPKTDLRDTGDSYVLEADMPGFRKEEIKLSLEGDVLTIAAEHTAEKQNEEAPEKDGESGETKTAEQPESKGTYYSGNAASASICSGWTSAMSMWITLMPPMKTAC